MAAKKKKVKWANGGVTFVVLDDQGHEHKFSCTGQREDVNQPVEELMRSVQDCVKKAVGSVQSGRKK